MKKDRVLIRDIDAAHNIEYFLVASVSTVLLVRSFLHLTGYPQIGNDTLHIAHMLWGGLIMTVVMLLQQGFLDIQLKKILAVMGGVGFGLFIDELGKFITADNDYFFQPTFSLFYIIFLAIFFLIEFVQERVVLDPREIRINQEIRKLFEIKSKHKQNWVIKRYLSVKEWGDELLDNLIKLKLFQFLLIGIFSFEGLLGILRIVYYLLIGNEVIEEVTFAYAGSYVVMVFFITLGTFNILRGRTVQGLIWYKRSLLVSLLVLQIFAFYWYQLSGIFNLFFELILLELLVTMIRMKSGKGN